VLHRWLLQFRQKKGLRVGKTKRGKGTKIMAITDSHGLPVAVRIESASPHEVTLVEDTLDELLTKSQPQRLIGDKAYDSDGLDAMLKKRGIEMISPNRQRRRVKTQDRRPLRRYKRRWKVERFFAWLHNFRRLITRFEMYSFNFRGFLHLGCVAILMRHF
jgi:transposase